MDSRRWQRLLELFEHAAALGADERDDWLEVACADDPALRREVEALLRSQAEADAFFAKPPSEWVGVAAPAPDAGLRVGPYRIVRELGRGGMGTVMLADRADGEYDAQVAIKFVQHSGVLAGELIERFRAERQILARLTHPHIARLLDGGTTEEGMPYVVMEYVEGLPIDAYAATMGLDLAARLELFQAVCAAVQHAHERGVIHRDLKPGNILVGVDGQPKLLDFGIAKMIEGADGSAEATRTIARRLTPEYASPEQVLGQPVGPATDVYGLGGVLYRLLTGRAPHDLAGTTLLELERVICRQTPARPSDRVATSAARPAGAPPQSGEAEERRVASPADWRRALRGDLDTIVLTALRIEPDRRYPSAAALSEDLERYRTGHPIQARPDTVTYRASKFIGRHRVETAVAVVAAGVIAAMALWDGSASVDAPSWVEGRVAVEVFENRTGDPSFDPLGAMAMDWVVDGLARTGSVEVVPGAVSLALRRSLPAMVGDDSVGTLAAGDRFGVETGAAHVVTGAIYQLGDSLEVRAQLIDARAGAVVQALTPIRASRQEATALLQPLRQRVTAALATVLNPLLADYARVLADPPGFDAYSEFIAGVEAYVRLDDATALDHLTRAAELEPSYPAPKVLAVLPLANLGRYAEADSLARWLDASGFEFAPFERVSLDFLLAYLQGDRESAARASARGAEMAPTSVLAYQAARDALEINRPREAIARLEAIAPDRGFMRGWIPYWSILTLSYHAVGDHRRELAAARRARTQYPGSLRVLISEIEAQAARGRLLALRSLLAEAAALEPQLGWTAERAGLTAIRELRAHGHGTDLAIALAQLFAQLAEAPTPSDPEAALGLALAHYEANDWEGAAGVLRGAGEDPSPTGRMRADAVAALSEVRLGRSDGFEVAARLEADTAAYRFGEPRFWAARLHAVGGRPAAAVSALRRAYREGFPHTIEIHREQDFETLRENPEFQALQRPVG